MKFYLADYFGTRVYGIAKMINQFLASQTLSLSDLKLQYFVTASFGMEGTGILEKMIIRAIAIFGTLRLNEILNATKKSTMS